MATKSFTKGKTFTCLNLLFYVLTAVRGNCTTPSPPLSPPPCRESSGGPGGVSGCSGGSSGSISGHDQPGNCPADALKLGVCASVLAGSTVGAVVGSPLTTPCCAVLAGMVDLEATASLCTAIRANVLGNNLNVPVSLSLLLNACGRTPPPGFACV